MILIENEEDLGQIEDSNDSKNDDGEDLGQTTVLNAN